MYVVQRHYFSESTIERAFSTKEKAEAYLAHFAPYPGGDGRSRSIEECEVDAAGAIHDGMRPFEVALDESGEAERVTILCEPPYGGEEWRVWGSSSRGARDGVTVHCWARDAVHAHEIAVEKQRAFVAEATALAERMGRA